MTPALPTPTPPLRARVIRCKTTNGPGPRTPSRPKISSPETLQTSGSALRTVLAWRNRTRGQF